MRKNGNWDDISLKLVMVNVEMGGNLLLKGGVFMSHHSTTTCMGLQSQEKMERRCVIERKRCISGICEKM